MGGINIDPAILRDGKDKDHFPADVIRSAVAPTELLKLTAKEGVFSEFCSGTSRKARDLFGAEAVKEAIELRKLIRGGWKEDPEISAAITAVVKNSNSMQKDPDDTVSLPFCGIGSIRSGRPERNAMLVVHASKGLDYGSYMGLGDNPLEMSRGPSVAYASLQLPLRDVLLMMQEGLSRRTLLAELSAAAKAQA